jgi:hypothetical protein
MKTIPTHALKKLTTQQPRFMRNTEVKGYVRDHIRKAEADGWDWRYDYK